MKKLAAITILILISKSVIHSFDAFTLSPRIIGVGSSMVAISSDEGSLFNGVAGASHRKHWSFTASYAMPYINLDDDDIRQGYLGIVGPVRNGSLSFAWGNLSTNIYSEDAILIGYAKNIAKYFDFLDKAFAGISLKYLRKDYQANRYTLIDPVFQQGNDIDAFTFDISYQQEIKNKLRVGFSFENLTKPDLGLKAKDEVERVFRIGIAFVKPKDNHYKCVELSGELNGDDFFGHFGAEYPVFNGLLILRSGYEFGSERLSNLSFGFGISTFKSKFTLDYAFRISLKGADDDMNGSHYAGISYGY
ncbi:MAG: hypothetical protein AB1765_08710 [Candidatus Hydrogenedentota bacterium]